MPPKKVDKGQQKAAEKAKAKVIEDKTFGLKNKNRSKTVQKYIKSVQATASGGRMKSQEQMAAEEHAQKEAKKAQARQQALLASLFKGAENMKKLAEGSKTDPKSIKEGQQIDIYTDLRDQQKKPSEETMDDWDQAKLEQVVKTKHGGHRPTTEIVCKYFLDALERRLYGWFWQCPNGESCHYRHCLPPGYVLKKKEKDPAEIDDDEEPIEEIIERERAELPAGGTPVTLETFRAWKARKAQEAKEAVEEEKRKAAEAKGKGAPGMSGRDLFAYNPSLFVDDAQAIDQSAYAEDEEYWEAQLAEEEDPGYVRQRQREGDDNSPRPDDDNKSEGDDDSPRQDDESDYEDDATPASSKDIPNKAVDSP